MRKQRVVLEHHADPALRRRCKRDHFALEANHAFVRKLESCDDLEERRLAGAAWAENGDELAAFDRRVDSRSPP
jgi:hypothetical protein